MAAENAENGFAEQRLALSGFFDCLSENPGGPTDAFLVRVGVHPKRHGLVAVSHCFRYAGNVRAAGDCDRRESVSQLMRVQTGDSTAVRELFEVSRGALRVHRLRAVILCEYPLTNDRTVLLRLKLFKEGQRFVAYVNCAGLPVFRRVQINALFLRIAKISGDCEGSRREIHIFPPERATLAAPDARINQDTDKRPPFQRFSRESVQQSINFGGGQGIRLRNFHFILTRFGTLYLVHRITGNHVPQIRHLKETVQNRVDFENRTVGLRTCKQIIFSAIALTNGVV